MNPRKAIDHISLLKKVQQGEANYLEITGKAEIERLDQGYLFRVDGTFDLNINDLRIDFFGDWIRLNIIGSLTSTYTNVNVEEKRLVQYSEGKIYSFSNDLWADRPAFFQSFYLSKQRHLIHQLCGNADGITFIVCGNMFRVYNQQDYLVIECLEKMAYDIFSEVSYNLLIAIGFITGDFIQDEVFIYQYESRDLSGQDIQGMKYRKLRTGFSSVYHAVATNPYHHSDLVDIKIVKELATNETLNYLDKGIIARLAELSLSKKQIQYALVLFNEANDRNQSLLIKNNCFFAVLEVLKKYFYDLYKTKLPKNYSSQGNINKYLLLFQKVFPITEDELQTIEMRNIFLHGDIMDVSGEEMVAVMQKQITLIYKLVLTHVGFDGHVIDHYIMNKQQSLNPFIKVGNK